ncbi:MAG: ABC transporter permease, partial [Prolixibacteraceae bacterium]|nr:ABC transporter permease [Prolixibacteraceae bacterium]
STYSKLYSYLNTNFVLNEKHYPVLILIVTGIIILVGVIAGGYPALTVSRHKPVDIIKKGTFGSKGKLTFRKSLILLQFTISVILLVGTIVIFRQLNYMKNSNLGFDKEGVVMVNFPGNSKTVIGKYDVLKDEILKNPNVISVSGVYTVPGINSQMNISVTPEGVSDEDAINVQALPADYGFAKSMGLEVVNGRDFAEEFSRDRYESVLLNQSAVEALGLDNPVGTRLKIPGDEFKNGVTVVGVVKDFHVQSFHNKINPVLIYMNRNQYISMIIRIKPENSEQTLAGIKTTWENVLPTVQFYSRYLEDAYNNLYSSEEKSGELLSVFTLLALFISCLGLFGFSSYIVSKRKKEVGIRKVMGARVSGISVLLSRQFTIWVTASGIIASPIAFILVNKWLQNFAFHTSFEWWIFVVAIGFELLVAILTVSIQSYKAAARNPVEALRYE